MEIQKKHILHVTTENIQPHVHMNKGLPSQTQRSSTRVLPKSEMLAGLVSADTVEVKSGLTQKEKKKRIPGQFFTIIVIIMYTTPASKNNLRLLTERAGGETNNSAI